MMAARKESLVQSVEKLELDYKYKELNQALELQKEKWLKLQTLSFA